ncbi:MAG TPA: MFS transporter, partial [Ktedonobacter sp.]|nr:MFS transporter [Ktedonobacter sp.]
MLVQDTGDTKNTTATKDTAGTNVRNPRPIATILALLAAAILIVLIVIGSRGLRDFDSALIGYAVASVFALAALVYRYTLWLGRPPTWRYFRAGWVNFLSWKNFRHYTFLIPKAWWTDILAQTFIRKRSTIRWVAHLCIFWGVILSLLITFPLTFGWLHFTLLPHGLYRAWFFGIPLFIFPIRSGAGFLLFHGLDFSAVLLLIGLSIVFWRRLTDAGLLAIQRYGFDLVPVVLLFSIAVTGLALTASSLWWGGRFYWFLSLTHEVIVVAWLISIPFGKFFHIIQRPASIGVTLYQTVNQDVELYGPQPQQQKQQAEVCKRCGTDLPSQQFITDLKGVLHDLGQDYDLGNNRGKLQDYCPTCKRILRGTAYYELMG